MRDIDTDQLAEATAQGAVIVDVREAGEFAEGHVRGAVNMPMGQLPARVGELDRSVPVLAVPALLLGLAIPLPLATGTSLVVITVTSSAALVARAGVGSAPDWGVVLVLTLTSVLGAVVGARLATRVDARHLSVAFTVLVLAVAGYTAVQSVPRLL